MVMALDIETVDSRGASFEYFREDFRIISMAISYRNARGEIVDWYSDNITRIKEKLELLDKSQAPIVVHNRAFEAGVFRALYPHLNLNIEHDTLRLAQLRDSGGKEYESLNLTEEQELDIAVGEYTEKDLKKEINKSKGLSLEACARRFLPPEVQDHKEKAHSWLRDNHDITKDFGRHLHLLGKDELRQYNTADTKITLLLFEDCMRYFESIKFDVSRDRKLYNMRVDLIASAYLRGMRIDREAIFQYILDLEAEIADIEARFNTEFKAEIREVRKKLYAEQRRDMFKLKTEAGRQKRWEKLLSGGFKRKLTFNLNSSKSHLPKLFVEILGLSPKFTTPKGAPSFKSSHLSQWGRGGEILIKRKKRILVLQQAVALYISSMYDNKFHPQIRAAGTRTNRVSSGR